MPATALYGHLVNSGAHSGDYSGATTALNFGDVAAEFAALRNGCGVLDAGWRSKFVITGEDRVRWLNGMVTNNIRDLQPGSGLYCFVLNPQGRIQGDLYCWNRGDYLLAETDAAQAQQLYELLDRYIVMDDVQLADVSAQLTSIAVVGPDATEIVAKAELGPELAPLQFRDQSWHGIDVTIARLDSEITEFEIWSAIEDCAVLWEALLAAGANPAGAEAYELLRIMSGRPRVGIDIRERDLPQETGQQRALNFSKGCYVGQEIVERIRSRGQVHRQLTGFVLQGTTPKPGTKFQLRERDVAEITSVAALPGGETLALGYARRDAVTPGTVLEANGTRARVSDLPFKEPLQEPVIEEVHG
jgi:folate-binding protein YgfZ